MHKAKSPIMFSNLKVGSMFRFNYNPDKETNGNQEYSGVMTKTAEMKAENEWGKTWYPLFWGIADYEVTEVFEKRKRR